MGVKSYLFCACNQWVCGCGCGLDVFMHALSMLVSACVWRVFTNPFASDTFTWKECGCLPSCFAGLHGKIQAHVHQLAVLSLKSICLLLDCRGKHSRHHKISESIRKQIDEHVRSFTVMNSHYSRSHHSKCCKHLSALLSVAEMHDLYLRKYKAGAEKPIVSYSYD